MLAARAVRAAVPKAHVGRPIIAGPAFRSYATATDSKPPIQVFGVDGTYASALVGLFPASEALKANAHSVIVGEASLEAVLQFISLAPVEPPDFAILLNSEPLLTHAPS